MKHAISNRLFSAGLAALLLPVFATGCIGYEEVGSQASGLNEVTQTPLGVLGDEDDWMQAPAGCEDRLDVNHSFVVASAPDSLVAALDSDTGEIVCVDSLESVQTELETAGREDDARELAQRFEYTRVLLPDTNDIWDDPSPQPSTEMDTDPDVGQGVDGADPSPQPS
ncbi:MAG: hypothetical protein AB8I08_09710 [Sandaracinaceae bacterium]